MGCQNNDIEVLNGSDTSFGKLQGKWIVVNYWADWCAPCIKEIPELVEFAEENKDILVYAFNFDELDSEDLAPIAKKFKVDLGPNKNFFFVNESIVDIHHRMMN